MKKLILSLFLFCSVFAFSQGTIPIPQIIGLPGALASKVDKVTGKSLVADTSIVKLAGVQAGAQVNKIEGIQKNGVDLTITEKKVNITVPTTAAEIGAQPAGAYATGTGTAYNSNNGDETLTSIKTKLGAATSVSDGYLKYQDYVKFDGKLSSEVDGSTTNELQTISTNGNAGNITLSNSGGTLNLNVNDADASTTNEIQDLSLSGNTLALSSDATTVDISQATAVLANTAKVSNATHTGDVTGSTALTLATVNSNVGTYNNVTINAKGLATGGSNVSYEAPLSFSTGLNRTGNTITNTITQYTDVLARSAQNTANTSTTGLLTSTDWNTFNGKQTALGFTPYNSTNPSGYISGINSGMVTTALGYTPKPTFTENTAFNKNFGTTPGTVLEGRTFGTAANSAVGDFIQNKNSSAQSANMWISGSSKSGVVTSYGNINVNSANDANLYITNTSTNGKSWQFTSEADGRLTVNNAGVLTALTLATSGAATFSSTVNSTGFLLNGNNLTSSLTTNYISKWNGSSLVNATAGTDYQLPITLTTNGTSGAATFSGNVLNVPNYSSSGGVNQTQTTVNGSVNGNAICSMPFQTSTYKKVIILLGSFSGSLTYTFPTPFLFSPNIYTGAPGISPATYSITTTSLTLSGGSNTNGWVTLEGF